MSTVKPSYVIVGAGVFGVSTAYHLIKKYPNRSITIIDRDAYDADSRCAASWDWNKVVRADYDDLIYCRMTIESQDIFKSDPLWKPYFHETGIYWMCRSDYAQNVIDNYKKLGRKADIKAYPVEEAKKLYGGLFADADYTDVKEVLVNKTSGWGAAGDCLRAVTKECLRLGVKYAVAEVEGLKLSKNGRCVGVKTSEGEHDASHIILSTGAYTPKLLEICAEKEGRPNLSAGSRILAAGIATGMVTLDEKSFPRFKDMPVGMQGYDAKQGPFLGSLPPTPDREIKWWGSRIFTNTHEVIPGRYVSAPPDKPDYGQWDVHENLREDIGHVSDVFYGKQGPTWKYEKHRICWDAFTTSSDFIISPHAASPGLYIATCGNFHGWKFFPVLGRYVVQMLEGDLEIELQEKWAWDRVRPDPAPNAEYPRHEMKTLKAQPLRGDQPLRAKL